MWEETTHLFLPLSLSVGLCAGSLRFCCGGWAVESITRWELFPDGRLRVGTLRQICCCCFLSFLLCLLVAKHYKIKPPLSLSLSFFRFLFTILSFSFFPFVLPLFLYSFCFPGLPARCMRKPLITLWSSRVLPQTRWWELETQQSLPKTE